MPIPIFDTVFQTELFSVILLIILVASARKNRSADFFPPRLTQEIKGVAILMVLFAHIGYEIFNDSNFLFPLSTLGGVGVDLFLLLSGYGLTISALKKHSSIRAFYQKRIVRLYVPLWITLVLFLGADALFLHITYPLPEIINAFLGVFPKANSYVNINAPLWYFMTIIFYYLVFPLIFSKKYPVLSSIGIYLMTFLVQRLPLPIAQDTLSLYQVHDAAFPIGMLLAIAVAHNNQLFRQTSAKIKKHLWINALLLAALAFGIWYTAVFSGVGHGLGKEQFIAMITTLMILLFFWLKKFEIRFCISWVFFRTRFI
jgi:peptidoglycan/LPS O-acetylase OafA/YrhL